MVALNIICLALIGYCVYRLSTITPRIEIYGSKAEVTAALMSYVPALNGEAVVIYRDDMNSLFVKEICDVLDGSEVEGYNLNDLSQTHRLARYFISLYTFALMAFAFIALAAYLARDFKLAVTRTKRRLEDKYLAELIRDKMYGRLVLKWLVIIVLMALLAVGIAKFQFIHTSSRIDLPAGQAAEFLKAVCVSKLLCMLGTVLLAATELVMLTLKGGKDRCRESER